MHGVTYYLFQDIELQRGRHAAEIFRLKGIGNKSYGREIPVNKICTLLCKELLHIFQVDHVLHVQPDPVFTHGPPAPLRPLTLVL